MKNRLEIAREFLCEDGVIFIQCDDNEQAYLKVLCDEIFGRENFVACFVWRKTSNPNTTANNLGIETEYIICFCKQDNFKFESLPLSEEDLKTYNLEDKNGKYKLVGLNKTGTINDKRPNLEYIIKSPENTDIYPKPRWRWSREKFEWALQNDRIVFSKTKNGYSVYYKQYIDEDNNGNKIIRSRLISNLLLDFNTTTHGTNEIAQILGKGAFNFPKPEALLKRIIEISTKEGDLVMDFFAGSGTTCAVAHKMNRRWIGIEQMDYVEGITKERLIKVINGEQGGISKAVGWGNSSLTRPSRELEKSSIDRLQVLSQSDFSAQPTNLAQDTRIAESNNKSESVKNEFIYAELMPLNALYKQRIMDCHESANADSRNDEVLAQIYDELQTKAFINYRVDIKEMLKDRDFETLPLADKKQILHAVLDKNMDYVLYSDIEDKDLGVNDELIALNKAFYEGENE